MGIKTSIGRLMNLDVKKSNKPEIRPEVVIRVFLLQKLWDSLYIMG